MNSQDYFFCTLKVSYIEFGIQFNNIDREQIFQVRSLESFCFIESIWMECLLKHSIFIEIPYKSNWDLFYLHHNRLEPEPFVRLKIRRHQKLVFKKRRKKSATKFKIRQWTDFYYTILLLEQIYIHGYIRLNIEFRVKLPAWDSFFSATLN